MVLLIRQASETDAAAATAVLRRSIADLCFKDHGNDPRRLEAWLSNKTVLNVGAWIRSPHNFCVVACMNNAVCGFGAITCAGEVTLCYVDPAARFCGVSSSILSALEHQAGLLGIKEIHLDSTATARRFYEERGFVAVVRAGHSDDGTSGLAMVKRLAL